MVVNWNQFNIGANEALQFQQPDAGAMVLNRVGGREPSQILGRLNANGQVFITNPNGILFGAGAQVNVAGLVASTATLSDDDFGAGKLRFVGNGSKAAVINQGQLTAAERGYIALLAPNVINQGVVSARLGSAVLAAGEDITLSFDDGGLLVYKITRGALDALVDNRQLVKADGGRVFMGALAAEQIGRAVVNNDGVIEALNVEKQAGVIRLMGDMHQGTVTGNGRLDASAPNGGNGGSIETSAATVDLGKDAVVTAAAPFGSAGSWLIDPTDYLLNFNATTQDGSASTVLKALLTTDVTISTASPGTDRGVITVDGDIRWGNGHTLTLIADTDIVLTPNTLMSLERQSDFGPELSYGNLVLKSGFGGSGKGTIILGENARISRGQFGNAGIPGDYGRVTLYYTPDSYASPALPGIERISAKTLNTWLMVSTAEQLQAMSASAAALKSNFAMAVDIDAGNTRTWNEGAGFMPVGDRTTPFTGAFDGMGHTVSNLFINRPESVEGVGLFGQTLGARISNIGLVNASVTGGFDATGALAGLFDGAIADSYVSGLAQNNYAGSRVRGNGLGFDHPFGAGSTGGLVGSNRGSILRSYSDAAVHGRGQVGGLTGKNFGSIDRSYSTGAVLGETGVGGLAGGNQSGPANPASISNSYSTGAVRGYDNVGGLVGENNGDIRDAYSRSDGVTLIAATGKAGGLVGMHGGGNLSGTLLWDTGSSGQIKGCGCTLALGTGLSSLEMTHGLHGLDPAIWLVYDGYTAPLLRSFLKPLTATYSNGSFKYNGEYASAAPYIFFSDLDAVLGKNVFGAHLDEALAADGSYFKGRNAYQTYNFKPQLYSNQKGFDIKAPGDGTVKVIIDPRGIELSATAAGKEYDGTLDSPIAPTADYLGKGDQLVASQSYDNPNASKDANDSRTLAVNKGYRIYFNGEDVTANYLIRTKNISTKEDARVVISPKKVVFSPVYDHKTYDTNANSLQVRQDLIGGDYIVGQQSFSSANAGNWRMIFKDGYTVRHGDTVIDPSNYAIEIGDPDGNIKGNILPKDLRAHAVTDHKTYDGKKDSGKAVEYASTDLIGNQKVIAATQAFKSENANPQAELEVLALIVDDGNGGKNYRVVNDAPGPVYGVIDKATLRLTSTLSEAELAGRVYDGTPTANGKVLVDGLVSSHGDTIDVVPYLESADAGARQVAIRYQVKDGTQDANGVSGNNYDVKTSFATLNVLPRPTTIAAATDRKVYDRNDISTATPLAGNAAPGQQLVASQRFADVNAGTQVATLVNGDYYFVDKDGKRVNAGNYLIRPEDLLPGMGSISQKEVTAIAQGWNKQYDGDTSSALAGRLEGVFAGDHVTVQQEFDSRNAGARTLHTTSLTEENGHHNYVIANRQEATGSISQLELTVNANPFTKTYDGNTGAAGVNTGAQGVVGGDVLVAGAAFQAADAGDQRINVDKGYYVRDALTGLRSENYLINTNSAAGSIAKKQLDVIANDLSKNFDGAPFIGGNGVRYAGFVNGETSAVLEGLLSYGGSAQGAVRPGRYAITPSGLVGKNYAINNVDGALSIGSGPGAPGSPSDPLLPATALPLSQVIDIVRLDGTGMDGFGKKLWTIDRLSKNARGEDYQDERERLVADRARRDLALRVVDQGMRLPAGLK